MKLNNMKVEKDREVIFGKLNNIEISIQNGIADLKQFVQ